VLRKLRAHSATGGWLHAVNAVLAVSKIVYRQSWFGGGGWSKNHKTAIFWRNVYVGLATFGRQNP
jgi:hypothetical protein